MLQITALVKSVIFIFLLISANTAFTMDDAREDARKSLIVTLINNYREAMGMHPDMGLSDSVMIDIRAEADRELAAIFGPTPGVPAAASAVAPRNPYVDHYFNNVGSYVGPFRRFRDAHTIPGLGPHNDGLTAADALQQLKSGRKSGHWIWYIFPQAAGIPGVPVSAASSEYLITSMDHAVAFLMDPLLGQNLVDCVKAVLAHCYEHIGDGQTLNPTVLFELFGGVETDLLKLISSMSLFSHAYDLISSPADPDGRTRFRSMPWLSGGHDNVFQSLLNMIGPVLDHGHGATTDLQALITLNQRYVKGSFSDDRKPAARPPGPPRPPGAGPSSSPSSRPGGLF